MRPTWNYDQARCRKSHPQEAVVSKVLERCYVHSCLERRISAMDSCSAYIRRHDKQTDNSWLLGVHVSESGPGSARQSLSVYAIQVTPRIFPKMRTIAG